MEITSRIMIIDDDKDVLKAMKRLLQEHSILAETFNNPLAAIEHLKEDSDYHTIITDVRMDSMTGLEVLKEVKSLKLDIPVILITAYGNMDMVIEALREGAYDFIQKPIGKESLLASVNRAIERHNLMEENRTLTQSISEKEEKIRSLEKTLDEIEAHDYSFEKMIGKSNKMQVVYNLIRDVSDTDANILITGETGTGKEMVARAIHVNSNRKSKKFVPVNCGALPENLIESELFGFEAGAFTGAVKRKIGKFEYASGGTLFLDEIGELPLSLQVKILRVLQERSITRLGGNETIKVDVRIITATNRNLNKLIKQEKFREDLFYRLNVINIHLPPLRERKEDIILLTMSFIEEYNKLYKKNVKYISDDMYQYLMSNDWSGNVRELKNIIERSIVLSKSDTLEYSRSAINNGVVKNNGYLDIERHGEDLTLQTNLENLERELILKAINRRDGNIQRASRELDIAVRTLYKKIQKYNIKKV